MVRHSFVIFIASIIDDLLRANDKHEHLIETHTAHTKDMVELARECGREAGVELMDGSYAFWPLPQFETPADI